MSPPTRALGERLSAFPIAPGRVPLLGLVAVWVVTLGAAVAPSVTVAAELTLTWTDESEGLAGVNIERKTGESGTYARIAQQIAGVVSYVDGTVVSGVTYCYRVQAFNSGGTSGYSNEACATPAAARLDVTVMTTGTGMGTVTSSPPGIACGTDCIESYPGGTVVTLTGAAASGSTFTGWSSACAGTAPCVLTGNTSVSVTATFTAALAALSVSPASLAFGRVSGGPRPPAQTVTVTAPSGVAWATFDTMPFADVSPTTGVGPQSFAVTPSPGMDSFGPGTYTDRITVSSPGRPDVVIPVTLTVSGVPSTTRQLTVYRYGRGRVTSSPSGIDCNSRTCVGSYPSGTVVTLTAIPESGRRFTGWSGACSGTGTCSVTLTTNVSVSATFSR